MKRKFLAAVLIGMMIFCMFPTSVNAAGETLISDRIGLAGISGSGSYLLSADIDLSGSDWTPLEKFSGTLNGGGHVISNLSITDTTAEAGDNKGLFESIDEGGRVSNLYIKGVNITAGDRVGGIAGKNSGTIENCCVTGTLNGGSYVGGIAGENSGIIQNCYSHASVSGSDYLGGLTGSSSGTINKCYAACTVTDSVMNNYLQFNTQGWIAIDNNSKYNADSFTLEAWFQWNEVGTNSIDFIIGKGYEQFEIHTGGNSGTNGIRFIPIAAGVVGSSLGGYPGDSYIDVHNVLQSGWFHVATVYSYDSTQKKAEVQVYVNGIKRDLWQIPAPGKAAVNVGKTATILRTSNPLTSNVSPINIGRRTDQSFYFNGKIADVRFWNTIRAEEQIKANKDKVLTGSEAGLVGYWRLNEASGDAIDSSSTHNNGKLNGDVVRVKSAGSAANKGALSGSNTGSVTNSYYDFTLYGTDFGGAGTAKSTTEMQVVSTYENWDFTSIWTMQESSYPRFPSSVTAVRVNPAQVSVAKGAAQEFTAIVEGTYSPAQSVIWTVEGALTGTNIDENGRLTVSANETASSITVRATSTQDPEKNAAASVAVVPGGIFAGRYKADSQVFSCGLAIGEILEITNLDEPFGYLDGSIAFTEKELEGKYFRFKETGKTDAGLPVVALYLYNDDGTPAYVAGKMAEGAEGLVCEGTVDLISDEGILFSSSINYGSNKYFISSAVGLSCGAFPNSSRLAMITNTINDPDLTELKNFNASDVLLSTDQILLRFYPNGEGVTGMPEKGYLIKNSDEAFVISASMNPSRAGYDFAGWNSNEIGSGDTYEPGAVYKLNLGLNLYAQWRSASASLLEQTAPVGVGTSGAQSVQKNGKITGTSAEMQYRTSEDENIWHWCTQDSTSVPAGEYWVRFAPKQGYAASEEVRAGKVLAPEKTPLISDFTVTNVSVHGGSDGKIVNNNFTLEHEYSIDGGVSYQDLSENEITGLFAGVVKVRVKAILDESLASEALDINVRQPAASAPEAALFSIIHVSTYGGEDGSISGVTTLMEYQIDSGSWNPIALDGTLSSLSSGEYKIRFKETGKDLASGSVVLYVKQPAQNASAPSVSSSPAATAGGKGTIIGTTGAMEYRLSGEEAWTDCEEASTSAISGTYLVRYKETAEYLPSPASAVTVLPALPAVNDKAICGGGTALIISGNDDTHSTVYIDVNRNGVLDEEDKSLKEAEVQNSPENNTDLSDWTVYGAGVFSGSYNTQITMLSGKVKNIYGAGSNGAIIGDVKLFLKGGSAEHIYGGGYVGEVTGSVNISIYSGMTIFSVYGGGELAGVSGNSDITISGGTIAGEVSGGNASGSRKVYIYGSPKINSIALASLTDKKIIITDILNGEDGDIILSTDESISGKPVVASSEAAAYANADKLSFIRTGYHLAQDSVRGTIYIEANISTLTVDPNGGTWSSSADKQNFMQGYKETKEIPVPVRAGHTFTGWTRTNSYGTMSSLTGAATYSFGSSAGVTDTITAQWKIIPEPIEYRILKGQNGKFIKGTGLSLSFTSDSEFGKFTDVLVDGASISSDNYTAEGSNNTVVKLDAFYLNRLPVGVYTLRIRYADGYAQTNFTIGESNSSSPATGDMSDMALWTAMLLISCCAAATVIISTKRTKESRETGNN